MVAEREVGKGVLATSATGHDAFAQIANANAGFWYCPALSLCVYGFFGLTANISWLTGRHSLFATPLSPRAFLFPLLRVSFILCSLSSVGRILIECKTREMIVLVPPINRGEADGDSKLNFYHY